MNDDRADAALDVLVPRLRQFIAVAREEHLTRAAEALGVPPSPACGSPRRRPPGPSAWPGGRPIRRPARSAPCDFALRQEGGLLR
jgi:hypothetical protein